MSDYPPSDEEDDYLSEVCYSKLEISKFDSFDRNFMPQGILERCVTRKRILVAMSIDHPNECDESLVGFTINGAIRLFATCVLLKFDHDHRLHTAMLQFQRNRITDKKLPIPKPPKSEGSMPSKMNPKDHEFSAMECGVKPRQRIWGSSTINDFWEKQWSFLVPVFSTDPNTDPEQYNLSKHIIIPFTVKHADYDAGSFGKVYKYEVHPNHIVDPARKVR